jgi:hypothetical protein
MRWNYTLVALGAPMTISTLAYVEKMYTYFLFCQMISKCTLLHVANCDGGTVKNYPNSVTSPICGFDAPMTRGYWIS